MIERIYIPTVRRCDNQITFENLPKELQGRVIMVIDPSERHLYSYPCEYLEIPESIVGTWTQLAQTRLFIHKHAGAIKYCVADDDIIIKRRNAKYWTQTSDMETSKQTATPEDILEMYETVDKWLDEESIGVVGLSDFGLPPGSNKYDDTRGVYSYIFYDGRMLSKIIDDIDICSLRVAEDVLFLFEVLSRGINTRKSNKWIYDNKSITNKELQDSRVVWTEMYKDEERPDNYYTSKETIEAMRFIQQRYPHGVKIYENDGKTKNVKYWKRVYKPLASDGTPSASLESFFS